MWLQCKSSGLIVKEWRDSGGTVEEQWRKIGGRLEKMFINLNTEARRHGENIYKLSEDTENLKLRGSVAVIFAEYR